jgi:hypothetical protein
MQPESPQMQLESPQGVGDGKYPRTDEGFVAFKSWWWNSAEGPHENGMDDNPADTVLMLMDHLSLRDRAAVAEYVSAVREHARTYSWQEGQVRYSMCPFYQSALQAVVDELAAPPHKGDMESITTALQRTLSDEFGLGFDEPDEDGNGFNLLRRMDSAMICSFNGRLSRQFPDARLTPRAIFDNPTVHELASRIHAGPGAGDLIAAGTQPGDVADIKVPVDAVTPWPKLSAPAAPFTQIVGSTPVAATGGAESVYEPSDRMGIFRRRTDGMESILIPGISAATIGDTDSRPLSRALANEQPCHDVPLSTFLIDVEPVSVGAFARFLNLVQPTTEEQHAWFLPAPDDVRVTDCPVELTSEGWVPKLEVSAQWPMILVTWFGANAYSLWAHGGNCHEYKDAAAGFLPSEAQWEYAARGAKPQNYPWVRMDADASLTFHADSLSE